MNISDEAVTVAAGAIPPGVGWSAHYRRMVARSMLKAAAQHMLAGAWDEATLANDCPNCSNQPAFNPYRKSADNGGAA